MTDYNVEAPTSLLGALKSGDAITLDFIQTTDNGIGMADEHLQKIFNMFFRISDEPAGSGIGLYIVTETVAKLNGIITVDSKENIGTTFSVQLNNMTP